jgi:3-keto-5-aminohexanoate cleavage enzyme
MINVYIGNIATAQAILLQFGLIISELPKNSAWSIAGIGECQGRMNAMSIVEGGGVRLGIEDNIWYDEERTRLATNDELVQRLIKEAAAIERPSVPPLEVRELLKLRSPK